MIYCVKCFSQVYKYAYCYFIIINRTGQFVYKIIENCDVFIPPCDCCQELLQ